MGIVDSAGNLVVEYKYDAWGKPVAVRTLTTAYETLAELNPFRYRGYVYDEETGLYYLRSRYYQKTWGRFVNADVLLRLNKRSPMVSQFFYCANDPIGKVDPSGAAENSILETIKDFFERIGERIGETIDPEGAQFADDGEWSYNKTVGVIAHTQPVEKVLKTLSGIASAFVMGALSTLATSSVIFGGIIGVAQHLISGAVSFYQSITIPDVPDGIYTLESVSYTEKEGGLLGHTYNLTYYYLYGYDTSGCEYFAIWVESYTINAAGTSFSSNVLAQRLTNSSIKEDFWMHEHEYEVKMRGLDIRIECIKCGRKARLKRKYALMCYCVGSVGWIPDILLRDYNLYFWIRVVIGVAAYLVIYISVVHSFYLYLRKCARSNLIKYVADEK